MNDGDDSVEDVAARMVLLREWTGLNQTAFAVRTGIAQTLWSHIELGRRRPSIDVANKLKTQWRVTRDWIYDGDRNGLSVELSNSLPRLSSKKRA